MRILFAGFMLASALAVSACDSTPPDSDPPGVVTDPVAYDVSQIEAGLDYPVALVEDATVAYSDAGRVTYVFASHDQFDAAAEALLRTSVATGAPLQIPSRLRSIDLPTRFAPPQEAALADDRGRVVIADRVYQLGGRPEDPQAYVYRRDDGQLIDQFGPVDTETPPSGARLLTNRCDLMGTRSTPSGNMYIAYKYSNESFRSWTRLRMIANTEVLYRPVVNGASNNCNQYSTATKALFPSAILYARVVGVDQGQCVSSSNSLNMALVSSNSTKLSVETRRPRGPNTEIEVSEHRFDLDGTGVTTPLLLFGQGNPGYNCPL